MGKFRTGDIVKVNNSKLRTNGYSGVVLGRHYQDYRWGDIETQSLDINILNYHGKDIITFISESNLELVKDGD